jgi:hypothetical protein
MRIVVFLSIFACQTAICAFEQRVVGARVASLGGSCLGFTNEVWSVNFCPGALALLETNEASFLYSPQPFGISELSVKAMAAAFPTNKGVIGFSAYTYGFELYKEFSTTLSYVNSLYHVGVGVNISYNSLRIQQYGSASTIGCDIGVHIPFSDQFQSGIFVKNINAPTIGESHEKLPQLFEIGGTYSPLKEVHLTFDYQKELGFDASTRFGVEYWMVDWIALRGGISDQPSLSSGGIGLRYSPVRFDYAMTFHQYLGWTHQVSMTISWGGSHG